MQRRAFRPIVLKSVGDFIRGDGADQGRLTSVVGCGQFPGGSNPTGSLRLGDRGCLRVEAVIPLDPPRVRPPAAMLTGARPN